MALYQNSIHDREKAKFDPDHRVRVLDRPEMFQNILDGYSFLYSNAGTIASLGTANYSFSTGAGITTVALNLIMAADIGPCLIEMFENTTLSALGTVQSSMNLNRTSLNVEDVVITLSPTISATGTRRWVRMVPGGKDGNAGGGQMSLIMKPNTTYLFRVTNNGNQTANYSFELMFMEQ